LAIAPRYLGLAGNDELLADLACVALNALGRAMSGMTSICISSPATRSARNEAAVETAFERIQRDADKR
jgi:hypothetical protein